jgi:hypothetical protein
LWLAFLLQQKGGEWVQECQYHRLYSSDEECFNDPYADITITGDKGSMDIVVCEEHLEVLASRFPTQESEAAQRQQTS